MHCAALDVQLHRLQAFIAFLDADVPVLHGKAAVRMGTVTPGANGDLSSRKGHGAVAVQPVILRIDGNGSAGDVQLRACLHALGADGFRTGIRLGLLPEARHAFLVRGCIGTAPSGGDGQIPSGDCQTGFRLDPILPGIHGDLAVRDHHIALPAVRVIACPDPVSLGIHRQDTSGDEHRILALEPVICRRHPDAAAHNAQGILALDPVGILPGNLQAALPVDGQIGFGKQGGIWLGVFFIRKAGIGLAIRKLIAAVLCQGQHHLFGVRHLHRSGGIIGQGHTIQHQMHRILGSIHPQHPIQGAADHISACLGDGDSVALNGHAFAGCLYRISGQGDLYGGILPAILQILRFQGQGQQGCRLQSPQLLRLNCVRGIPSGGSGSGPGTAVPGIRLAASGHKPGAQDQGSQKCKISFMFHTTHPFGIALMHIPPERLFSLFVLYSVYSFFVGIW